MLWVQPPVTLLKKRASFRKAGTNSNFYSSIASIYRSVFPLPPLQREIKSPDLEDETTASGVFVKPEPLSTTADQSLNGSVGSTCSPDKIKTEIKAGPLFNNNSYFSHRILNSFPRM